MAIYAIPKWSDVSHVTKAFYPTAEGDYGGEYTGGIGEGELVEVLWVDAENERLHFRRLNGIELVAPVYRSDIATWGQMTIGVRLVNVDDSELPHISVDVLVSRFPGQHALQEPYNNANYVGETVREGEVLQTTCAPGAVGDAADKMVGLYWKDANGQPVTAYFDTLGSNHPSFPSGTKNAQWVIVRPNTWASVPTSATPVTPDPGTPADPGTVPGIERRIVLTLYAGVKEWARLLGITL